MNKPFSSQHIHPKIITLLMIGLFLFVSRVFAQSPAKYEVRFGRLGVEDGLSHASVLAILQDPEGFLWFGTRSGLNKFDGYTFTTYRHDPENAATIGNNWIEVLYQDSAGTLWIGTHQGLTRFDRKTQSFTNYTIPSVSTVPAGNTIYAIYPGRSLSSEGAGEFWIGTGNGSIYKFDTQEERFTSSQSLPDISGSSDPNSIRALHDDGEMLWVGTQNGGLYRFEKNTAIFTMYHHDPYNPESLPSKSILSMYEDSHGGFWIGTERGGISKFDRAAGTFTTYRHDPHDPKSPGGNTIWQIYEDRAGILWFATEGGGLSRFDRAAETFVTYRYEPNNPDSISANDIRALCEDRSGILWIGTWNLGINTIDPNRHKFYHYKHHPDNPDSLSLNLVRAIHEDHTGILWIGTEDGGLNKFDRTTETFTRYRHDPENPNSLSHDHVTAIVEDHRGILWVATWEGTLNRFDPAAGTFTHYRWGLGEPTKHGPGPLQALLEDRAGRFWIGGRWLSRFDRDTGMFTHYIENRNDPTGFWGHSIQSNALLEDRDGFLWIGTWRGGLNKFDPRTEQFTHYLSIPENPATLSDNRIISLCEDHTGFLWVGTPGGGLNKLDPRTGQVKRYFKRDGLPDNFIYGIIEDAQGYLWISTDDGLARLDPHVEQFTIYTVNDGLQSNRFFWGAAHKTGNGELVFGGVNGFNIFDPAEITANPFIPPVYLTSITQAGLPLKPERVPEKLRQIKLDWRRNFFEFEFAVLNYTRPENNQYAYILEGLEEHWNYNGTRRFGRYTNLPDGTYTLRLKGANNDGVWNEQGMAITVTVVPPFWRTWWFRSLAVLLTVGGIAGGVSLRVRAIEVHRRELEIEVRERTKELIEANTQLENTNNQLKIARQNAEIASQAKSEFLSNMSHELRTPLNSILGYAQILRQEQGLDSLQREGLNIMFRSGQHLLTLINDILDLSKIEARKVKLTPTEIHLSIFLDEVIGIIRMRAQQKDLSIVLDAVSPLPSGIRADEKRLRQILLNLLGNAVKFTESGGTVTLVVRHAAQRSAVAEDTEERYSAGSVPDYEQIRFEVIDTGVGMKPGHLEKIFLPFEQIGEYQRQTGGTGLGLAISRQLVELMGGELRVSSVYGKGSRFWFEITVPVVEIHFPSEAAREQRVSGYTGSRRTVLVVDDKPSNRTMIINMLTPIGFHCLEAANGQEAVEQASQTRPEVILMDLMMPVMNGLEAARAIRQYPELRDTVIIAMSASMMDGEREQSRLAGCQAFLPKPVDMESLFALLETYAHLTWEYEACDEEADNELPETDGSEAALIPPPSEKLEELYELALRGNLFEIQEQAAALEQRSSTYRPFARKMSLFARNYEDEQLLKFIEYYRKGSTP